MFGKNKKGYEMIKEKLKGLLKRRVGRVEIIINTSELVYIRDMGNDKLYCVELDENFKYAEGDIISFKIKEGRVEALGRK